MENTQGLDDLNKTLGEMLEKASNIKPALQEIAVMQTSSFQENFIQGGRPLWIPSNRVKKYGGQTLLISGRLMKSTLLPQVTDEGITFGSNLPYAAIHQRGFDGTETVRSFVRKVRSRNVFGRGERVNKKTGEIRMGKVKTAEGIGVVKSFTRHMRMPARPFIVFQPQDIEDAGKILLGHLVG
jgi:phage gpG-like protein